METLKVNDFVCEYKCNMRYERCKWKQKEEEYKVNGEGCYVVQAMLPNGKWMCFDATRNFCSMGRYLNHSHSRKANVRLHTPLLLNNKWRVGIYAIRDIQVGDELCYDYGEEKNKPGWMKLIKVHYC